MDLTKVLVSLRDRKLVPEIWSPGMLLHEYDEASGFRLSYRDETHWYGDFTHPEGRSWIRVRLEDLESGKWQPSLRDPATVGILLNLLRVAARDEHVTVAHPSHNVDTNYWMVWAGGGACVLGRGYCEGMAIAHALEFVSTM